MGKSSIKNYINKALIIGNILMMHIVLISMVFFGVGTLIIRYPSDIYIAGLVLVSVTFHYIWRKRGYSSTQGISPNVIDYELTISYACAILFYLVLNDIDIITATKYAIVKSAILGVLISVMDFVLPLLDQVPEILSNIWKSIIKNHRKY